MVIEQYIRGASYAHSVLGANFQEYTFENCDFTESMFATRPRNLVFVNCIGTVVFATGADYVLVEVDGLEPQMIIEALPGSFYTLG